MTLLLAALPEFLGSLTASALIACGAWAVRRVRRRRDAGGGQAGGAAPPERLT